MGVGDVSIDLSSADIGMAEERLDGTKVGAVHEQVGGERMAKGVRGNMLGNASKASVFFDDALDTPRGEAAEITILRSSALIFGVINDIF